MKRLKVMLVLAAAAAMMMNLCVYADETDNDVSEDEIIYEDDFFEDEEGTFSEVELDLDDLYDEDSFSEDDFYDFFNGESTPVESDQMVDFELSNPFGDPVTVKVWDGVESEADTDDATYSAVASSANYIYVTHEIIEGEGEAADVLADVLKEVAKQNTGYVNIEIDEGRRDGNRAWSGMSFSGLGMSAYVEKFAVEKLPDGHFLKTVVDYSNGLDAYGDDYTPAEDKLAVVIEALGLDAGKGEAVELNADSILPVIELHEYTVTDPKVGDKVIYVWEEEPYLMTASDYAVDYDEDLVVSTAEEAEEYEDEELDDESEEDPFVCYASTSAKGVFASIEIDRNSDPDTADTMVSEYLENLGYFGAESLKRSEVMTTDHASWICVQFGENEAEEAYRNLKFIYGVVTDDDTYTALEIYAPADCDQEQLTAFLNAYGITFEDCTIEVEQESYDASDFMFDDEEIELDDSELDG